MLDCRGFSAWITSDDLEHVEFEPRFNHSTNAVTCWIAGMAGKVSFLSKWFHNHHNPPQHPLVRTSLFTGATMAAMSTVRATSLSMGTRFLGSFSTEKENNSVAASGSVPTRSARSSSLTLRQVMWCHYFVHGVSRTRELDDCAGPDGKPADKNVGSITLDIKLVKRVEERDPNPISDPPEMIRGRRQEGDVAVRSFSITICTKPCLTRKQVRQREGYVNAAEDMDAGPIRSEGA